MQDSKVQDTNSILVDLNLVELNLMQKFPTPTPTPTDAKHQFVNLANEYQFQNQPSLVSASIVDEQVKSIIKYIKLIIWIICSTLISIIIILSFALWLECGFSLNSCSAVIYTIMYTSVIIIISIISIGYWITNFYASKMISIHPPTD